MDSLYRIHPSVFYRDYSGFIVVYQTASQKVYTFTEGAGFIFQCLQNYVSVDDVIRKILIQYEVPDHDTLKENVECLFSDLLQKGIVIERQRQTEVTNDLEKEISSHFQEGEQLYTVTMELTYHCNEHCRHCYICDENREEVSLDTVKRVLDEMAEMNVMNVVFTGGELFTRKDAFDILEYAYSKHFLIDIFTNGTLIDGNDYIRLKSIWPRCVHFSLYSYIPEKHDAVTQIKGSFEKTMKSIRACITIGIPVNIKVPVFAETVDDVNGVIELANDLGCSVEPGKHITPKKNGDLSPLKMQVTGDYNESKVDDAIDSLIQIEDNRVNELRKTGKICGAGDRAISIDPYGEVFPCNMLQLCIGNIHNNSVEDIWENSEKLKWWRQNNRWSQLEGCKDCSIADKCTFCPGEAMMITGDPFSKYAEACHKAAIINKREKKGGK